MEFKNFKDIETKYKIGGDWLKLEEGDNKVRIVSQFEDYGTHFNPATKRSVVCVGKENCLECKQNNKPKVRFLGWVIDRKSNQVKLLEIGYKIFKQIGAFAKSEEYAFSVVPDYDIVIKRSGQGLDTDYVVMPSRKITELTEKEKEKVKNKTERTPADIIDTMKAKVVFPENEPEDLPAS